MSTDNRVRIVIMEMPDGTWEIATGLDVGKPKSDPIWQEIDKVTDGIAQALKDGREIGPLPEGYTYSIMRQPAK